MAMHLDMSSIVLHIGVVRVEFGSNHHLPENKVLKYFEDKSLSDGGPVERIAEPGDGTFVLTFMNPEDAERVLCRNHNYNGVEMNVSSVGPEASPSKNKCNKGTDVNVPFKNQMMTSGMYDDIGNTASFTTPKALHVDEDTDDENCVVNANNASITALKVPFVDNDVDDNEGEDNAQHDHDNPGDKTQEINVDASKFRYIQKHHKKALQDIVKEVKLKVDNRNFRFVISGRKENVAAAVKTIDALLNGIDHDSFTISRPRVLDFLNSKLGQEKLARVEEVTKTTLDVGEGLYALIGGGREIAITVVYGDIVIQEADVLVDTVGPSLKLCEGALSAQMLRAGGQELQTQCNNLYPNGIAYGDVVKTVGGRLQCKEVYHCCIPKWNGGNFKDLEDILFLCLNDAANSRHKSITFPALGTGSLKYPAEKVASLMVSGMKPVLDTLDCLETVTVVLNPGDTETIKHFNAELQKESKHSMDEKVKVTENEIGIGDMSVKIKQGDITTEDTDCIVNSADSELKLTKGPLSKAISRACGQQIHKECRLKVAEMKKHGIVVTTAPMLRVEWIIHASFEHFHGNIKEIVTACLKTAQMHNMSSISFPPLGTGYGSIPVEQMCKVLITALRKNGGKKSTLREIRVVIYEKDKHRLFLEKLREVVAKLEKEKLWKRVVSGKRKVTRKSLDKKGPSKTEPLCDGSPTERQTDDKPDYLVLCNVDGRTEEAEVKIYSPSRENRKRAFEEIQKLCDHQIIEKTFRNMKITTLTSTQLQQLKKFLTHMNMKITVYPEIGKVQVEGFRDTVLDFQTSFGDIVDSILSQESP